MEQRPFYKTFGFAVAVVLPVTAFASFTLFDNFNNDTTGNLAGQGGWVSGAPGEATVAAGTGTHGEIVNINPTAASKPTYETGLGISTASTVYWNFMLSSVGGGTTTSPLNWNFILTDSMAPADTAGSSQVQFNNDGTASAAGLFRVRDGGSFDLLSTTAGTTAGDYVPKANIQYNVWFVLNPASKTYEIFIQSDGDPLLASPTQLFADSGTSGGATTGDFAFRNAGTFTGTLNTVNIGNQATNPNPATVTIDDIYVDKSGKNLTNPVPEPATVVGLVFGLGSLASFRRRRAV